MKRQEAFKVVPDSTLELAWPLMKPLQMKPEPIPDKYRELIAAAMRCRYCTFFNTEMAKK